MKAKLSAILLLVTVVTSTAQAIEIHVDSVSREVRLDELVVSAARRDEVKLKVPQQVVSIYQSEISRANVRSTADLMSEWGTLSVQKSQQGGGSPVIRGFEGSRVLLMVDNVKMNNLIYRSGHLQNIITIDQSILRKAEVLFGSSSVMYGSDALGGVIHFYTRDPLLNNEGDKKKRFNGNAFYRYGTANNESTAHLDINLGNDRFASLTSFTYSRFGDLRSGTRKNPFLKDDEYIRRNLSVKRIAGKDSIFQSADKAVQNGSGFSQYDLLQKFLYQPNKQTKHLLNFQFSNTTDVPRYDRLTEIKKGKPKFAEWYYGPQFRLMTAYNLHTTDGLGADEAGLTLSYQKIKESRHNRNVNDLYRSNRMEAVDVLSLSAYWMKLIKKHTLHTGIDASLNFLRSTAFAQQIETDERLPLDTRYPDGKNGMHNIDLFASHRWNISNELVMTDGARLGYSTLNAHFIDKQYFPFLQDQVKQQNLTASAYWGLNYTPTRNWKFALLASSGFRVPNIDDLGKVFDSKAGMVVVPNPHIKPEKSVNVELSITYAGTHFSWETTGYGTYFFDAIALAPTQFNGQDSIVYNNEKSRVYANTNNRNAYLVGCSSSLRARFLRYFSAEATLSYTYGRLMTDSTTTPLDHIPPLFGRVGVGYLGPHQKLNIDLFALFNGRKALENYNLTGEDNIAYATQKGMDGSGLPAWMTLNLKAGYQVKPNLLLQLGVENILNTEYRTFGSGINGSGRNIYATLRFQFR